MFDLTGKCALVTGASGGIGSAIARSLHARGATVCLHGTRHEVLNTIASELKDRVNVVVANLSGSDSAAEEIVAEAEAAMGQLDILINNAGITRDGLALRMKDADFCDVINLNLTIVFRLCRSALRGMIKRRSGRIVNISSVVGVTGNPGQANYVASKAGLIGLTKSLALEVANRGVTVNAVAPGLITSAITDKLTNEQREKYLNGIPIGRIGDGSDVAGAVSYLASTEAGYVTGQTLHVNGGMAMI
ncbi:MAG TPA: 3-oxoacyl-[acyl-carrier-protein] reductase [Rhodospirillaceae bacterium]|nr:3-oxoacyl-[acyl-carrier-protein] reductase [Candidatus Neomarinimicrobiota bacterium]HCX14427.1 3-oxoacyl-[acyl-carrier-protein] reductase [Rhodospirillaceae bacterium]